MKNAIISTTETFTGFTLEQMQDSNRKGDKALAKHLLCWALRNYTDMKLEDIGELFGNTHATVVNSINFVENAQEFDKVFAKRLNLFRETLIAELEKLLKTVQLVGAFSQLSETEAVANFERAKKIMEARGYTVVSPVDIVPRDASWNEAMGICINSLVNQNSVALLNNWSNSPGARVEYAVALALGKKIIML